ncbi:MAG: hypothetical protein KA713_09610 [Chryseotalea sp. WA131a]|nr:MAG: hypothetical protein KA713_09610 [Chryseotalea sp. WA131a]
MTIKETFEQKGAWELVYIVGFCGPIFAAISDLVDNSIEKIPLTIIGLFISVGLGLGIYRLVKAKTHWIKSIVIVTSIICIILLSIPIQSFSKRLTYDTCDICGFVSVDKQTHECQMCVSKEWDDKMMTGYTDKEQYIKEEQLFWFSTESSGEKVNFYIPEGERNKNKFPKDGNWKPLVTDQEVIEYSRKNWRE